MTTGTKAIMAAAGGGGSAGAVKYPIITLSDASGSDKYYLHAVDTEGNIAWTKEIGGSTSFPYNGFPTTGNGYATWLCEVGTIWWVMYQADQKIWAFDSETGACSGYDSGNWPTPAFSAGAYGPMTGNITPVYFDSSGGTDTLGWLQIITYFGGSSTYFQGYKFTSDRTATPTVFGDFTHTKWGNQPLYDGGGAMVNYDYNSTSKFHNWKEYATGEVYFAWQEGSSDNSYNVKIMSAAIDQDTPVSVSNVSNLFGPTSNYSRGTAVRICSGLSMQKYFDENWCSYNGTTSMGAVSGDTGDSFGITSSNVSSQKPPLPTITSPYDFGSFYSIGSQGNMTFDYETSTTVTSDGVKGMWGFIRSYATGWTSKAYNLGYVETGTTYSGGQSMNYESGGDGTDYSDVCYRATADIYQSSPSSVTEIPSIGMRRINDNGYIGMWCPNFATSNQRWEIRILDATNGQVGSTVEFDFPVEHANKPTKHQNLREDCVWTQIYSGSNTS